MVQLYVSEGSPWDGLGCGMEGLGSLRFEVFRALHLSLSLSLFLALARLQWDRWNALFVVHLQLPFNWAHVIGS